MHCSYPLIDTYWSYHNIPWENSLFTSKVQGYLPLVSHKFFFFFKCPRSGGRSKNLGESHKIVTYVPIYAPPSTNTILLYIGTFLSKTQIFILILNTDLHKKKIQDLHPKTLRNIYTNKHQHFNHIHTKHPNTTIDTTIQIPHLTPPSKHHHRPHPNPVVVYNNNNHGSTYHLRHHHHLNLCHHRTHHHHKYQIYVFLWDIKVFMREKELMMKIVLDLCFVDLTWVWNMFVFVIHPTYCKSERNK